MPKKTTTKKTKMHKMPGGGMMKDTEMMMEMPKGKKVAKKKKY